MNGNILILIGNGNLLSLSEIPNIAVLNESQSFYPTPTFPLLRGGSKKFTNDLGLLYLLNAIRTDAPT
jgi:hypothetical protein